MKVEYWRPVVGFEGYFVSNLGRVRGKRGEIMSQSIKRGYKVVRLFKEGKIYCFSVHRLVAKAFLPNPFNLPQVNHKDENPSNNFVFINPDGSVDLEKSNLEWCDCKYNINYGTANKRRSEAKTNNTYNTKAVVMFSFEGVPLKTFPSAREAGRFLKKSSAPISKTANHQYGYRSAYGYKWEWV